MFPSFMMFNSPNSMLANIVLSCKRVLVLASQKLLANFFNLNLGQFRITAIFTISKQFRSAFFNRIMNIVFDCTNKQMLWVKTRRIVTFMKHTKFAGNIKFQKQSRTNSMNSERLSSPVNLSITSPVKSFGKIPTVSNCVNVSSIKQSFLNTWKNNRIITAMNRFSSTMHRANSITFFPWFFAPFNFTSFHSK